MHTKKGYKLMIPKCCFFDLFEKLTIGSWVFDAKSFPIIDRKS